MVPISEVSWFLQLHFQDVDFGSNPRKLQTFPTKSDHWSDPRKFHGNPAKTLSIDHSSISPLTWSGGPLGIGPDSIFGWTLLPLGRFLLSHGPMGPHCPISLSWSNSKPWTSNKTWTGQPFFPSADKFFFLLWGCLIVYSFYTWMSCWLERYFLNRCLVGCNYVMNLTDIYVMYNAIFVICSCSERSMLLGQHPQVSRGTSLWIIASHLKEISIVIQG